MICIGYRDEYKTETIEHYVGYHDIKHIVIVAPEKFRLLYDGADSVTYEDSIEYPTFYRLLQEIDGHTLVVLNECMRTQNRYDLTYNCIRHFLNQTRHQIVFQQLPQIDTRDDFMILFDFDTQSRWKSSKFDINLILDNSAVNVDHTEMKFTPIRVPTTGETKEKYTRLRKLYFDSIGARDPHILPRRLHLIGGKDKLAFISKDDIGDLPLFSGMNSGGQHYVARNKRLGKLGNIVTYLDVTDETSVKALVDLPHRFVDFSDFVKITNQFEFNVLISDLKVDHWYFNRYVEWSNRINEACSSLRQ